MNADWQFKLLFDGNCPYCVMEIKLLRRMNREGNLAFEDIAAAEFDPGRYGKTHDDVMATMHGVYADGQLVTGMNVFREAYRHVGLGWLLAPTGWPGLRWVFDRFYAWFARHRVRLGRLVGRSCDEDRCTPHAR